MGTLMKNKLTPPAEFDIWPDYAIAAMGTRGPQLDKLFDCGGSPSQDSRGFVPRQSTT